VHGEWTSADARERREPDKARSVRRALPDCVRGWAPPPTMGRCSSGCRFAI